MSNKVKWYPGTLVAFASYIYARRGRNDWRYVVDPSDKDNLDNDIFSPSSFSDEKMAGFVREGRAQILRGGLK